MRMAFDIHGTLDESHILRNFVRGLDSGSDHQIFIISGPPHEQIAEELVQLGIVVDKYQILSVVDYLKNRGTAMWLDENGWWCDEEIWWESKGLICRDYHISMIFDDKIRYKRHMPHFTKFVLWIG